MINKILIANRGEIAVRIIRTCKKMNIKTVAVYSKCDKDSYHVFLADEAYCIGNNLSEDSYLNYNRIIEIAIDTKCDAIHPGYGFLSESYNFEREVIKNNIIFIGPSIEVMKKVANKVSIKNIVKNINEPIINSYSLKEFLDFNRKSDFPVLIKLVNGGGGKGIIKVSNNEELIKEVEKLKIYFKDKFKYDDFYVEKYINVFKHIDIQIMADKYGNISIFPERDCSVQRKFQKFIEESPSTISSNIIDKLKLSAFNIAKHIGYDNIGTIEYLLDEDLNYYFLEINARIQVEHTLSEVITGIDLVQEQIKFSNGVKNKNKLFLSNKFHALECRINAENVNANFLPSCGKIRFLNYPLGNNIRIDTFIYQGYYLKPYYDSLLMKIIVFDKRRNRVINNMKSCLDELIISGIKTNADFNYKLISDKKFIYGNYSFFIN